METKVLHEITPLDEHDFMYVADRHKKEFTYPIQQHLQNADAGRQ